MTKQGVTEFAEGVVRVKELPVDSGHRCTWRCFECGHTADAPAWYRTRDGGLWGPAPIGWLFVHDMGGELTFVCSVECLNTIYADDT